MKKIVEVLTFSFGLAGLAAVLVGGLLLISDFVHPTAAHTERDARNEAVAKTLSALPEYSCFAELEVNASNTVWQIPTTKYGHAHMLVAQDANYVLYAQPHPVFCENAYRPCTVYWLRTESKKEIPLFNVDPVPCPEYLTRDFIRTYIRKNYPGEISLGALR